MRINHNISAMVGANASRQSQIALSKSIERLSTGLRINSAADDATGLSISETLRAQVRGTTQAKRNANEGLALLTIAEGAANEISNILQRMRELSVSSANGTLSTAQRSYADTEFGKLNDEITRIESGTKYNGVSLFGATIDDFQIGANNSTTEQLGVTIDDVDTTTLGINADTIDTAANALTAMDNLDDAIGLVNDARAKIGSDMNVMESALNTLSNQEIHTSQAESMIRDVDFAAETTNFTRAQILSQSAMTMVAQANAMPASVLSLFQ